MIQKIITFDSPKWEEIKSLHDTLSDFLEFSYKQSYAKKSRRGYAARQYKTLKYSHDKCKSKRKIFNRCVWAVGELFFNFQNVRPQLPDSFEIDLWPDIFCKEIGLDFYYAKKFNMIDVTMKISMNKDVVGIPITIYQKSDFSVYAGVDFGKIKLATVGVINDHGIGLDAFGFTGDSNIQKAAQTLVKRCVSKKVDLIIMGYSGVWGRTGWELFYNVRNYANLFNLKVVTCNEKYTSATSFLDGESPDKVLKTGRRNLENFTTDKGIIIDADLNAAYQIIKKKMGNFDRWMNIRIEPEILKE